ncbi:MAG: hypothetical protein ACREND_01995 [Gemmatimonadaceae bacterium]
MFQASHPEEHVPPSVTQDYVHYDKVITTGPILTIGPRRLKWYDMAVAGEPVPGETRGLARKFLAHETLDQLGELGFVILHRCGKDFHFLIACSWRNENELWESVWAKQGSAADFHDWSRTPPHQGTYCVWELGAVVHEQQAWIRYLRSERDAAAVTRWLTDQYEGVV